jgi:hypothetical protein
MSFSRYLSKLGQLLNSSGQVTVAGHADGSVTYAKIQNVTAGKVLGRDTSGSGVVQELPIVVDSGGSVAINLASAGVRLDVGGPVRSYVSGGSPIVYLHNGSAQHSISVPSGASPSLDLSIDGTKHASILYNGSFQMNSGYGSAATAYGCRAWIKHNSSTLQGSGNISSLTRNGTGDYTINFTNAMPDANYAPSFMGEAGRIITTNTGSFNYARILDNGTTSDGPVGIHIFR